MPVAAKIAALIVAAGRGSRAGEGVPKQYRLLAGEAVLSRSLRPFLSHPDIGPVQVVIHPDDRTLYETATASLQSRLLAPVAGGSTRQASVLAGLEALSATGASHVLIHDAARPFVTAGVIDRVLAALATHDAAIAAVPVSDTLKRAGSDNTIAGTLDRSGLWQAQTPQGFRLSAILAAHRTAVRSARLDLTDDAAAAEAAGIAVALVPGNPGNVKLTTAEDFAMASERLSAHSLSDIRTGTGFDVHRFTTGDHVWLCGVRVPHDHGLEGHSDADAPLHALTDAVLGAIGAGDIGQHFPPSDPQWQGASSDRFLAHAADLVAARGGVVSHVDVTILTERPRIGPYREAMRARIAAILEIEIGRTSVKATTTERLGFTGRGEGLAALASATVRLPWGGD